MRSYDPRTLFDKALAACLGMLVGAVAVFIAVRLIEAVWVAVVVITLAVISVALAISLIRNRGRGW